MLASGQVLFRRLTWGAGVVGASTVAVAVVVALLAGPGGRPAVALRPTGPAPQFQLAPLAGRGLVSLGPADGRAVVLNFFASWCDDCKDEMRTMAALTRAFGRSVRFIGIDVNDEAGDARRLLAQDHVTYPVGVDFRGVVADRYRVPGLPTTVFLDARHEVVGRALGALSEAQGRAWVTALERDRPI